MKKFFKMLSNTLDKSTYFIPHIVLAITIHSFFFDYGKYDFATSIILIICYISTCFGEYYYMRFKVSRDAVKDIVHQVNEKDFITRNGLLQFADMVDKAIVEEVDALRQELKGDAIVGKMDSENSEDKV